MPAQPKLTIAELLGAFPPSIAAVAEELRPVIVEAMPGGTEKAYPGWRAIGYRDEQAGYVCGIFLFEDSVRLIFEHGHLLPDPRGVLEGSTKQTRHLTFRQGDVIHTGIIQELVQVATALGTGLKRKRSL